MNKRAQFFIYLWLAVAALWIGKHGLLPDFYPRTVFVVCGILIFRLFYQLK